MYTITISIICSILVYVCVYIYIYIYILIYDSHASGMKFPLLTKGRSPHFPTRDV